MGEIIDSWATPAFLVKVEDEIRSTPTLILRLERNKNETKRIYLVFSILLNASQEITRISDHFLLNIL